MENNIQARLEVKFTGNQHNVSIETLIKMLETNQVIYRQVLTNFKVNADTINIKVTPPEKGSFLIDIILEWSPTIGTIVKEANEIICTLGGYIAVGTFVWDLFKKRKGKTIKKGEKAKILREIEQEFKITQQEANTIINVYNTSSVRTKIENTLIVVKNDTNINGITFTTPNTPSVKFNKQDFTEFIEYKEAKRSVNELPVLRKIEDFATAALSSEGLELEDSDNARYFRYAQLYYNNEITKPEFVYLVKRFTKKKIDE